MDFTTKIANISHTRRFNRAGTTDNVTSVTFFVGDFGPFYHDFTEGQDGPAQVNAYMDSKATEVRQIAQRS